MHTGTPFCRRGKSRSAFRCPSTGSGVKGVTTRGIWIGLAVLIVVFAAVAPYAVRSLEGTCDSLEETTDIEDEALAAVSGMREGIVGIGRETADYVRTDDPKHRERVSGARETFRGARTRYEDLVGEAAGRDGATYLGAFVSARAEARPVPAPLVLLSPRGSLW